MELVYPENQEKIGSIEIPQEFYWAIKSPTPLAGMQFPLSDFPWQSLHQAGFRHVVSLEPGTYDPAPLKMLFRERLEDLAGGFCPLDEAGELDKIRRAVSRAVSAWRAGEGVVVHCLGGIGRTGTVLGCILQELGFSATEVIGYLSSIQQDRGCKGWIESEWQEQVVHGWKQRE